MEIFRAWSQKAEYYSTKIVLGLGKIFKYLSKIRLPSKFNNKFMSPPDCVLSFSNNKIPSSVSCILTSYTLRISLSNNFKADAWHWYLLMLTRSSNIVNLNDICLLKLLIVKPPCFYLKPQNFKFPFNQLKHIYCLDASI